MKLVFKLTSICLHWLWRQLWCGPEEQSDSSPIMSCSLSHEDRGLFCTPSLVMWVQWRATFWINAKQRQKGFWVVFLLVPGIWSYWQHNENVHLFLPKSWILPAFPQPWSLLKSRAVFLKGCYVDNLNKSLTCGAGRVLLKLYRLLGPTQNYAVRISGGWSELGVCVIVSLQKIFMYTEVWESLRL